MFRYSKSVSSSNFKAHYKSKHPSVSLDVDPPDKGTVKVSEYFVSFVKPATKKRRHSSEENLAADAYLMIARDNLPLQTVSNEGLNTFLCKHTNLEQSESDRGFKTVLPSRRTVTRAGEKIYKELRAILETSIVSDNHIGAAATFDIWTDRYAKTTYCGITYHFIDNNFDRKRVLLDASKFGERHTADNIGLYVNGVLGEYKCEDRIKMFVTDAASNNKKWGTDQDKPRMNCDAHALHHLITTDSVKKVSELHELVKKAKKIVYTLTWRRKDLEEVGILTTIADVSELLELDEQFGTSEVNLLFGSGMDESQAVNKAVYTHVTGHTSAVRSVMKMAHI